MKLNRWNEYQYWGSQLRMGFIVLSPYNLHIAWLINNACYSPHDSPVINKNLQSAITVSLEMLLWVSGAESQFGPKDELLCTGKTGNPGTNAQSIIRGLADNISQVWFLCQFLPSQGRLPKCPIALPPTSRSFSPCHLMSVIQLILLERHTLQIDFR